MLRPFGFLCALFGLLFTVGVNAGHQPPPLADPIPGTIPTGPFTVKLNNVVSTFEFPTNVAVPADGTDRMFVPLRDGRIMLIKNGSLVPTPFLDIRSTTILDSGSALSVIAFHPDFALVGSAGEHKFYTISQEAAGTATAHLGGGGAIHQSVLYEWRADVTNPDQTDMTSRREILRINDQTKVHNPGDLVFGPDGYLYMAIGDDDLDDNDALDGSSPDGTIFRIDIDDTSGNGRYTIPTDNPYVGNNEGFLEEIFAWGFRNPWRIAFHPDTGALYAADIGEDAIEEINIVTAQGYYGWNDKEGSFAFLGFNQGVTDDLTDLPPGFDGIDPLAQYDHDEGDRSITGGFIYRGSLIPALAGHYLFGDFVSGRLMHLDPVSNVISEIAIDPSGDPLAQNIIGFGETEAGEILIVATDWSFDPTGRVIEVVDGSAPGLLPDGDLNLDGIVDVRDLLLMQRAMTLQITLGLAPAWHADLYPAGGGDGELGMADLLALEALVTMP